MPRTDYGPYYQGAGAQWRIDPLLLQAVAGIESGEGANTGPSSAGARGHMQFVPETAARYGVDVNNPVSSIYGAANYLDDLLKRHNGNLQAALSDYGGDRDGAKGYANTVISRYRALTDAWGGGSPQSNQPPQVAVAGDGNAGAPTIVDMTKQAGFGNRFGNLQPVQGMIIHHTSGGSGIDGVISTFKQTNYPAQYVIGKDGTIYQTLPDGAQGQQIQQGKGLGTGLSNANTIGVEVIAENDNDVNEAQIKAGQQLTNFLGQKYGFNPYTQVYGHGEVNPGHKEATEGQKITTAQRFAMGTGPQPPTPGTVPGPTLPPGEAEYRGGLPPTVAFDSQGVPYNPYAVGANAVPSGVSIPAAPSPGVTVATAPDAPGGGTVAQQPSATNAAGIDFFRTLKPQVDENGEPIAPAKSPAAAPGGNTAPDAGVEFFRTLQPQVDEQGHPLGQINTGQEMWSATSPGAKATGTSFDESRVPGPAFQAKINLATDPAQRARIAAATLFPNDPNGLNRIIAGSGGRMAAVGDDGKPFFIEPQPVLTSDAGITRPTESTGTGSVGGPVSGNIASVTGTPGARVSATVSGGWQPTSPFSSSAYGAPFKEAANLSPGNIVAAAGGGVPNALVTGLPYALGTIGNPLTGSLLTGGANALLAGGRQALANYFDPNKAAAPDIFSRQTLGDAAENALLNAGFRVGGALFRPATMETRIAQADKLGTPLEKPYEAPLPGPGIPPAGGGRNWGFGRQQSWEDQPLAQGTQLPGERPVPLAEVPPATPPVGPAGAPRPGVQLNPAGDAAAVSGPYAASTPEEVGRIPEGLPPLRMPILSDTAAANRADQIIRHFAANGSTEADTRDLIPGSPGSLAQVTGNAGIATLERAVRNLPEATNIFNLLDTAQQEARRTAVGKLVGTPDDLAQLYAARDASTAQARQTAFANKTTADPSAALAEIDKTLAGPEGKRPGVATPLRQIRDLFYTTDPATGTQMLDTDPEMLYGVRKAITDSLSPLARGTANDARAAAAQLQPVLKQLDAAIEAGAPGYADYMKTFAEQSKPIDAMEYLQGRNLTDANGYPTLQKVDQTLKDIQKQRTLQSGARPADALSDEQISGLEALRDDLRRQANLGKGKALGSNTVQNLAGSTAVNALTGVVSHGVGRVVGGVFGSWPGYFAGQGVEGALAGLSGTGEARVRQALIDRLLNKDNLGVRALSGPALPMVPDNPNRLLIRGGALVAPLWPQQDTSFPALRYPVSAPTNPLLAPTP